MELIIYTPQNIPSNIFEQVVSLIKIGRQVRNIDIAIRNLKRADFIATLINDDGETVVSTATLKNPSFDYKSDVFKDAGVPNRKTRYKKELGYIVTHPEHEEKGYCKALLKDFFPLFKNEYLFATTRKDAMIHILKEKFGFKRLGNVYKEDLVLMIYEGGTE